MHGVMPDGMHGVMSDAMHVRCARIYLGVLESFEFYPHTHPAIAMPIFGGAKTTKRVKVGVNGFGRIGRLAFRAAWGACSSDKYRHAG
jgi:hypothetical protein